MASPPRTVRILPRKDASSDAQSPSEDHPSEDHPSEHRHNIPITSKDNPTSTKRKIDDVDEYVPITTLAKKRKPRKGRGKQFGPEEAVHLARAWCMQALSHRHQKEPFFWGGIEEKCRKDGMTRSAGALKTQWSYLYRGTQKYMAAKVTVMGEKAPGIGKALHDKIMRMYRQKAGWHDADGKFYFAPDFKYVEAAEFLAADTTFNLLYGTASNSVGCRRISKRVQEFEMVSTAAEDDKMNNMEVVVMQEDGGSVDADGEGNECEKEKQGQVVGEDNGVVEDIVQGRRCGCSCAEHAHIKGGGEEKQTALDGENVSIGIVRELRGIKYAVEEASLRTLEQLKQLIDVKVWEGMRDGPEKREFYAHIIEERKLLMMNRTGRLRENSEERSRDRGCTCGHSQARTM